MKRIITGILAASFALGCTAPERTEETLKKAGFTDIKTGGFSWFDCGKGDFYVTTFTARNVNGMEVEGTVCCGLLKSCTVRF